jgi:hypothetical protein
VPAEKIVQVLNEFMSAEEEREAEEYRSRVPSILVGSTEPVSNVTFQTATFQSGKRLEIPAHPATNSANLDSSNEPKS